MEHYGTVKKIAVNAIGYALCGCNGDMGVDAYPGLIEDAEERKSLIEENADLWKNRHKIQGAYRQIKSLGKRVTGIYEHKTMTPAQKKKELRRLFDRMMETSRKALD